MGIRVSGSLQAALLVMTLTLVAATGRTESPDRSPSSPRTFVAPESCSSQAACAPGYWVFRAPDCEYHNLQHSPGVVLLLESGQTLQCRCRLVWLLTKEKQPPFAKVSCAWVDLEDTQPDD